MYSPNIRNDNPQPDNIDEEIDQIDEVDMQHPRVAGRFSSYGHLFHVDIVLIAEDPRVWVEAVGAEVQHD